MLSFRERTLIPPSVQSSFCMLFGYILDRQLSSLESASKQKYFAWYFLDIVRPCHCPEQRTQDVVLENHCEKDE